MLPSQPPQLPMGDTIYNKEVPGIRIYHGWRQKGTQAHIPLREGAAHTLPIFWGALRECHMGLFSHRALIKSLDTSTWPQGRQTTDQRLGQPKTGT